MLSKCANPQCSASFLYLRKGKLFRIEMAPDDNVRPDPKVRKPSARVEYFWLCDDCASSMTLLYKKGEGVIAIPQVRARAASGYLH